MKLFNPLEKSFNLRIAPSPTGDIHPGNAYIIAWNLAFKVQNNAKLILRIDDTDEQRFVDTSLDSINNFLSYLDVTPDLIFKQSERKNFYTQVINDLFRKNYLYYCNCSTERIESLKLENKGYDGYCFDKKNTHGAIRFRGKDVIANDILRGEIKSSFTNDVIVVRSNGIPTYHIASCIDDFLCDIAIIIRSVEWLPSISLHASIFNALSDVFGFTYEPKFLHMPMLLDQNGAKLSKRNKSMSVNKLMEEGILPKALLNYFLSISSNNSKEIFSLNEVNLNKIRCSSPKLDKNKILWFNRQYIIRMDIEELENLLVHKFPLLRSPFFDVRSFIVRQRNSFSTLNDFYYSLEVIFLSIEEYKNKLLEIDFKFEEKFLDYFDELIKILKEAEFDYKLNDAEFLMSLRKQGYALDAECIHFLRFVLLGKYVGMSVPTLLLVLKREWIIQRLIFFKDHFGSMAE